MVLAASRGELTLSLALCGVCPLLLPDGEAASTFALGLGVRLALGLACGGNEGCKVCVQSGGGRCRLWGSPAEGTNGARYAGGGVALGMAWGENRVGSCAYWLPGWPPHHPPPPELSSHQTRPLIVCLGHNQRMAVLLILLPLAALLHIGGLLLVLDVVVVVLRTVARKASPHAPW